MGQRIKNNNTIILIWPLFTPTQPQNSFMAEGLRKNYMGIRFIILLWLTKCRYKMPLPSFAVRLSDLSAYDVQLFYYRCNFIAITYWQNRLLLKSIKNIKCVSIADPHPLSAANAEVLVKRGVTIILLAWQCFNVRLIHSQFRTTQMRLSFAEPKWISLLLSVALSPFYLCFIDLR